MPKLNLSFLKTAINKVKSKSWTERIGIALKFTATIVDGLSTFIPGASIIGGALTLGSTLLNPEEEENEIQEDLDQIRQEIQIVFKEVTSEICKIDYCIKEIENIVKQTLKHQIYMRFKDPLEEIEMAYDQMLIKGRINMKSATRLLRYDLHRMIVKAKTSLKPEKIKEYLEAITDDDDDENKLREKVMQHCILVSAKFLIVTTLYYIHQSEPDDLVEEIAVEFEHFNSNHKKYLDIYSQITGEELQGKSDEGKDIVILL